MVQDLGTLVAVECAFVVRWTRETAVKSWRRLPSIAKQ